MPRSSEAQSPDLDNLPPLPHEVAKVGEFFITDVFGGLPEEQLELDRLKDEHNAEVAAALKPKRNRHIHLHLGDK